MQKKIILVTGATGAQGGSVAEQLLKDAEFSVRCLTRNPNAAQARALQEAGAEIVKGDLNDLLSLSAAMEDVYGVFGAMNFREHSQQEYQQGKNLIFAVVTSRIDHFIFSSLPAAAPIGKGKYNVPHFDIKASLEAYAKSMKPDSSFVHVAGYYENFLSCILPRKTGEGKYILAMPQGDTPYASVSVTDLGAVVSSMFRHPAVYKKRTVGVVGSDMNCHEYAAILSKVLGIAVEYKAVPGEAYAAQSFPGTHKLADMYSHNGESISNRKIDLIESYGLNPSMQPFEHWVRANRSVFEQAFREKIAV